MFDIPSSMSYIPAESPSLPIEILQQIALHLDIDSARSLARTCTALRDAGEIKLWEDVDLRSAFDHDAAQQTGLIEEDLEEHKRISRHRLQRVLSSLSSYPFRTECIYRLTLDYLVADTTVPLLKNVAPRLEYLGFLPLPVHLTDTNALLQKFYERLDDDIPIWPRLKHLRFLPLDLKIESLDVPLSHLLAKMPVIDTLELSGIETCPPSQVTFPSIPTLRHLKIDEFHVSFTTTLKRILLAAPNIRSLTLAGWDISESRQDKGFLQALKGHKGIKEIVWLFSNEENWTLHGVTRSRGLVNVQDLVERVQDYPHDEYEELYLGRETIPLQPSLKRFCAITGPRPTPAQFIQLGMGPDQPLILRIDTKIAKRLLNARHLISVQYTADPDDELIPSVTRRQWGVEPEIFVPSVEWVNQGMRGTIIRMYGDGRIRNTFIHTKTLSRVVEHDSGEVFVGIQRAWTHHTSYRERTVPMETLLDVCEASKGIIAMDWLEGARGLELPRVCERMLDRWWESVQGEEGDSDNYSDEDSDEEDDDEEDEDVDEEDEDNVMEDQSENEWITDEEADM